MVKIEIYRCDVCRATFDITANPEKGRSDYISHLKVHAKKRLIERRKEKRKTRLREEIISKLESEDIKLCNIDDIKKYSPDYIITKFLGYNNFNHTPKSTLKKIEYFKKNGKIGYILSYDLNVYGYISSFNNVKSDNAYVAVDSKVYNRIVIHVSLGDYDENGTYSSICKVWKNYCMKAALKTSAKKFSRTSFCVWKASDDKTTSI